MEPQGRNSRSLAQFFVHYFLQWIFLVPVVGLLLLFAYHDRSPVDLGRVHEVSLASSQQKVADLIGRPTSTALGNGVSSWYYGSPFSWYEFRVSFDANGKVTSCGFND